MSFQVFSRRDVTLVFMLFSSLDVELNAPFWEEDVPADVDEFEIEWEENMYECWFFIPNANMRIFTYQDTKNGKVEIVFFFAFFQDILLATLIGKIFTFKIAM